jgi:hypothetical protein
MEKFFPGGYNRVVQQHRFPDNFRLKTAKSGAFLLAQRTTSRAAGQIQWGHVKPEVFWIP